MRPRAAAASRLPFGGFAGLDPALATARVRSQVERSTSYSKIVLLFEERCLDKKRSFRNDPLKGYAGLVIWHCKPIRNWS